MPTDTPHDALRKAGCASLAAAFCALLFLGASAWHFAAQREADSARAALLATRLSPEAEAPVRAAAERKPGADDPDGLARRAEAAQGSARRAALALMVAGLATVLVLAMVCAAATRRAIRRWRRAEGLAAGWRS